MPDRDRQRAMLERELGAALLSVPAPARDLVIERLGALLQHAAVSERMRCASRCRARASMWRTTRMARSDSPPASVQEARARANEAEYLADALEVLDESFDPDPTPGAS